MEGLSVASKLPKLLGIENYFEWRTAAEDALLAIGASHVLHEDVPEAPVMMGREEGRGSMYVEEVRQVRAWLEKDQKARGIIQLSLSNGIRMSVDDCTTAKELWKNLEDLHELDSMEFKADVTRDLVNLRFTPGDDPKVFLEAFSTMMLKAKAVGIPLTDKDKSSHFMNALHSSFVSIKSEWRMMEESKRSFMALRSLFNQRMAELDRDRDRDASSALYVKNRKTQHNNSSTNNHSGSSNVSFKKAIKCWNCGKMGHYSGDCRSPKIGNGDSHKTVGSANFNKKAKGKNPSKTQGSTQAQDDLVAFFGNTNDNMIAFMDVTTTTSEKTDECPRGSGKAQDISYDILDGSGYKSWPLQVPVKAGFARMGEALSSPMPHSVSLTTLSSKNHESWQSDQTVLKFAGTASRGSTIKWILDLGATEHIVNDPGILCLKTQLTTANCFVTAGGRVDVTIKGAVRMFANDHRNSYLTVGNVYCLPSSPTNLLSQGLLLDRGWDIQVTKEGGQMRKGNVNIQLHRSGNDGRLREIVMEHAPLPATSPSVYLTSQISDTVAEWHVRLGHMGVSTIKSMEKEGLIKVIDLKTSDFKMEDCDICAISKATRLTFGDTTVKATKPLEIIHSDLAGPLKPSIDGHVYYITFIDDFTHYVFVRGLTTKSASDIADVFKRFEAGAERVFGERIKILRTDGGTEYKSPLTEHLVKKGIIHQVTTPYTPQLNGVAERWNRTLKSMTGSMLLGAKLDMAYWVYALEYSAVILNMGIMINGKPLYETYFKRRPNFQDVQPFGTTCWVRIPSETRLKDDLTNPKALKCQLLGFNLAGAGYLVLNEHRKVIRSRDVIFKRDLKEVNSRMTSSLPPSTSTTAPIVVTDAEIRDAEVPAAEGVSIPLQGAEGATPVTPAEEPEQIVQTGEEEGQISADTPPDTVEQSPGPEASLRQSSRLQSPGLALTAARVFMTGNSDAVIDPLTYGQAIHSPEASSWKEAMDKELTSVGDTGTWMEVVTPPGRRLIGSKWVYKTKRDASGNIAKFKARIVAQGFSQIEGIDYDDTFSPVARLTSLRLLLAITAVQDLQLHQMDADTAFLNGTLEEEIYMAFPPGYHQSNLKATGLHLIKSLYGLKQSPRVWWKLISGYLESIGFKKVDSDWGLYFRQKDTTYLLLYVDDVLIAAPSMGPIEDVKKSLKTKWKWSDMGEAAYVLGLKMERDRNLRTIRLSQEAYIDRILARFGMNGAGSVTTPLEDIKLQVSTEEFDPSRQKFYLSIIGSLMWISQSLRPDISFAVSLLSRFGVNPTEEHLRVSKRVLRYLKGTAGMALTLGNFSIASVETALSGYCDADYAGDINTRRSTTGYLFKYMGSSISWGSVRQATVALSTCEAEYMALAEALKEGMWLSRVLKDLGYLQDCFILFCDNQGAIALSENPGKHSRSKHIDVRYHFIRERVDDGQVDIRHVGTLNQAADMLTKALNNVKHTHNCQLVGLKD